MISTASISPASPVAPERKRRCRMLNRLSDRCSNEAVDSDEASLAICAAHALQAAQLLAEAGAITITFGKARRRTTGATT